MAMTQTGKLEGAIGGLYKMYHAYMHSVSSRLFHCLFVFGLHVSGTLTFRDSVEEEDPQI